MSNPTIHTITATNSPLPPHEYDLPRTTYEAMDLLDHKGATTVRVVKFSDFDLVRRAAYQNVAPGKFLFAITKLDPEVSNDPVTESETLLERLLALAEHASPHRGNHPSPAMSALCTARDALEEFIVHMKANAFDVTRAQA